MRTMLLFGNWQPSALLIEKSLEERRKGKSGYLAELRDVKLAVGRGIGLLISKDHLDICRLWAVVKWKWVLDH